MYVCIYVYMTYIYIYIHIDIGLSGSSSTRDLLLPDYQTHGILLSRRLADIELPTGTVWETFVRTKAGAPGNSNQRKVMDFHFLVPTWLKSPKRYITKLRYKSFKLHPYNCKRSSLPNSTAMITGI